MYSNNNIHVSPSFSTLAKAILRGMCLAAILVGAGTFACASRHATVGQKSDAAREHSPMMAPIIIVDPKRGLSTGSSGADDMDDMGPGDAAGAVYEHSPMMAPIIIVDPKGKIRA